MGPSLGAYPRARMHTDRITISHSWHGDELQIAKPLTADNRLLSTSRLTGFTNRHRRMEAELQTVLAQPQKRLDPVLLLDTQTTDAAPVNADSRRLVPMTELELWRS